MTLLDDVRAALPGYAWHLVCEMAQAEYDGATVEVGDLRAYCKGAPWWRLRVCTWGQHPWVGAVADGDDLREMHDRVWPEFAAVRNETLARLTGVPIAPPARVVP